MKFLNTLSLAILCVGIGGSAHATEAFRTDINPALTYYQAFAALPDLHDADRQHLFDSEWRGRALDTRFEELIVRYDSTFKLMRQAVHSRMACDWGLDLTAGPELLLPSLAKAKSIAQVARLRAMWHLLRNRPEQAREDLVAAFVLGRNVSKDGVVISALVQIAIENILANAVAENIFEFTPQMLDQIISGFDASPSRGTIRDCMQVERAISGDWFATKIRGFQAETPGNETAVMGKVRALFGRTMGGGDQPDPGLPERLIVGAGGTSASLIAQFEALGPVYDEATLLLGLPYAEFGPAAAAFEGKLAKSTNPMASVFIPALSKARGREFFNQVKLAMLRAAVEYRSRPEDGFRKVMDPCGNGPFALERLVVANVDRGFLLKSKLATRGYEEALVFADKKGAPLYVDGKDAGKVMPKEHVAK